MLSVLCLMTKLNHNLLCHDRFLILACTVSCMPLVFYRYHGVIHLRNAIFLGGRFIYLFILNNNKGYWNLKQSRNLLYLLPSHNDSI